METSEEDIKRLIFVLQRARISESFSRGKEFQEKDRLRGLDAFKAALVLYHCLLIVIVSYFGKGSPRAVAAVGRLM